MSFPSDLEIASQANLRPLTEIAANAGIPAEDLEPFGSGAAKITLDAIEKMADRPKAKYVVVSAITPTPLGEGKTTTTVGLGQAFQHIGSSATIAIRQPSMGPTFGIKGGAAGGGYSQVVPMELFNLHLTGDMHAVTAAHNLCSAMVDAHLYHGNEAGFDIHNITWRRVVDINDRALRNVTIGLGGKLDGIPRETGFDITAASEVMAALALATDLHDLRARMGRIVLGYTKAGDPITAEQIGAA
ncbi:MAG: formate--tetrahydrofolate ligase, partial [Actinomycetota bacterium]|nr:formate--tetrahydrofolate ligase [Actinomycetota bacterium]